MISALRTQTYWLCVVAILQIRNECPRTELWHLAKEDYVIRQFILVLGQEKRKESAQRKKEETKRISEEIDLQVMIKRANSPRPFKLK